MPKRKVVEAVEEEDGMLLVRKTVRIPVHYEITKSKEDRLEKLTARLTYGIVLINELVTDDTELDETTLQRLIDDSDIAERTGLSSGFMQQCRDVVLSAWKSYESLHEDWQYSYDDALEKLRNCGDDEKDKIERKVKRLERKEPSLPTFRHKTPCWLDGRTGEIKYGNNTFLLWMRVSTLERGERMNVPLNPSYYHLKQLEEWAVKALEIVKNGKKFYAHTSLERRIPKNQIKSVGGMDQGLNRTIATVLLPARDGDMPYEGLVKNELEKLVGKYDDIVAELQRAKRYGKLRELRNKRANVSMYHDFYLARQIAEVTDGYYMAIGNANFRQTQFRENGMPTLRKRIGKWPYSRQRDLIALRRAELGYNTLLVNERNTSNTCPVCGSRLVSRKYLDGTSWILCHSCGAKLDADIVGATNTTYKAVEWLQRNKKEALRCLVERLKVRMNRAENPVSA